MEVNPEKIAERARELRQQAYQIERSLDTADQSIGEQIAEFGLPTSKTISDLNAASARARRLRAEAARLEGDHAYADRLERQAQQVLRTGSYDR